MQDRPAVFARELMNLWADKLRRVAGNAGRFGLAPRLVEDIAGELIVAANRLGLAERIAGAVRRQIQAANVRWEDSADRAVSLAAPVLNDFCADLGTTSRAVVDRPRRPRSDDPVFAPRSEEHTSELQSLMRISYAVFCLKTKKTKNQQHPRLQRHECIKTI